MTGSRGLGGQLLPCTSQESENAGKIINLKLILTDNCKSPENKFKDLPLSLSINGRQ